MGVRRKYRCGDCGFQFEHLHADKREPMLSDCPECVAMQTVSHDVEAERMAGEAKIIAMVESGIPPAVRSNKTRAIAIAERAMEDMGHTNFNDSGKQGDVAAKAPAPMQTREIEQITREAVEAKAITEQDANAFSEGARNFWQGGQKPAADAPRPPKLQQHINAAPTSAAMARQAGVDPIKLLHDGEKKTGGIKYDVVARAKA